MHVSNASQGLKTRAKRQGLHNPGKVENIDLLTSWRSFKIRNAWSTLKLGLFGVDMGYLLKVRLSLILNLFFFLLLKSLCVPNFGKISHLPARILMFYLVRTEIPCTKIQAFVFISYTVIVLNKQKKKLFKPFEHLG